MVKEVLSVAISKNWDKNNAVAIGPVTGSTSCDYRSGSL